VWDSAVNAVTKCPVSSAINASAHCCNFDREPESLPFAPPHRPPAARDVEPMPAPLKLAAAPTRPVDLPRQIPSPTKVQVLIFPRLVPPQAAPCFWLQRLEKDTVKIPHDID